MRIVMSAFLAAALGFSAMADAQFITKPPVDTRVDRTFESSPRDCADVRWSASVLERVPSIGSACRAVEQRNGKSYVKLEGVVEDVRDEGKRLRVDLKEGEVITIAPTPRTVLYIDGKRTEFGELREGTRLNFYIPEDRLQAELQPRPDRVAFVVVPLDLNVGRSIEQARGADQDEGERDRARDAMTAANLPQTASTLPYLLPSGVLLLMIGAGLTLRRKLRNRWNAWF